MNNPLTYRSRTPLGTLLLAAQNGALTEARFVDAPAEEAAPSDPVLQAAVRWLDTYFSGRDPGAVPPCRPKGTPFQTRVWNALSMIPYGRTRTYAELAVCAGCGARSARAVGAAVGRNPIALFLPCHRVLGAHGALTGYAYGLARKSALLRLERGDGLFACADPDPRS